jgi:excisionase family DNA binding protein
MAGKFLLLEEAARHLGVSPDQVHRLVEKKKLFPLRDGTTLKFKIDELDRLAAEVADPDEPVTDTLELDLDDVPASHAGGPIELADSVAIPGNAAGPASTSQLGSQAKPASVVLGGSGSLAGDLELGNLELGNLELGDLELGKPGPAETVVPGLVQEESIFATDQSGQDDLARTMLGAGAAISGLDAMELDLDSIVGLSSPSVAAPAGNATTGKPAAPKPAAPAAASPADSGTLAIDLSGIGVGSQPSNAAGSNATGSLVLGSGVLGSGVDAAGLSGSLTNAGAALSGALDSGLSLEDGDAAISGIDLGALDEGQLLEDGATALAGDDFELGDLGGDDDSASVVAVEPESGDSSFFATEGGESSDFTGDIPLSEDGGTVLGEAAGMEVVPDTKFSVWQISGLVCCALLLLTGGFVMFDLMRTIGSPDDLSLSSPLLNPLSTVFGWR